MMKKRVHITALYTLLHFLVDLSTVYLVCSVLLGAGSAVPRRAFIIVAYNLIAFAFQFPLGVIADRLDRNSLFAACGCLLAAAAYPLAGVSPYLACFSAALGNGAFHVGGGIDVLNISLPRAALPGVFVSSGALGVWLAYRLSGRVEIWVFPLIMLLGALALGRLNIVNRREYMVHNAEMLYSKPAPGVAAAFACFMAAVVLRSYLGMIMDFDWKGESFFSLGFVSAVVLGKCLGGVLGDLIGWRRMTAASLLLAAALFAFSFSSPLAGILAVFLFNMTMPITLSAMAVLSRGKHGFAFGASTIALFIGFALSMWSSEGLFTPAGLALGALLSAALMYLGLTLYAARQRKKDADT